MSHVGQTEVPAAFYEWAAISVLASALGDRTWYEKFKGAKLVPNLYVLLIGPSGLGKGLAIDAAQRVINDMKLLGEYRGQITGPAIVDHLYKRATNKKIMDTGRFYLITPELSMSVGSGDQADRFVKLMTELYTGGDYEFKEATRTNAAHSFRVPCMNWLGGSTERWAVNSITPDAIEGGFFARTIAVPGEYDFSKRNARPEPHPNFEALLMRLRKRVHYISTRVSGKMSLSLQAKALDVDWYENRAIPHDEALLPSWKRAHDLSLKLGMIFAKDEDPNAKIIMRKHLARGQRLADDAQKLIPRLVTLATMTPESDALQFVQRIVQTCGDEGVPEHELVWRAAQRGLTKERTLAVVGTLVHSRRVSVEERQGKDWYAWKTRKIK